MTTRESLVRAIRDNPADDTLHLAFADFAEEQGEPEHAELIRLSLRQITGPKGRQKALSKLLRRRWRDELGLTHPECFPHCHRGFPTHDRVSVDSLARCGDSLLTAHPLRRLWVTPDWPEGWDADRTGEFRREWEQKYPAVQFQWPSFLIGPNPWAVGGQAYTPMLIHQNLVEFTRRLDQLSLMRDLQLIVSPTVAHRMLGLPEPPTEETA